MVGKEVKHVSQTGDLPLSHEKGSWNKTLNFYTETTVIHPFVWETLSIGMVGMFPKKKPITSIPPTVNEKGTTPSLGFLLWQI